VPAPPIGYNTRAWERFNGDLTTTESIVPMTIAQFTSLAAMPQADISSDFFLGRAP